MVVLCGTYHNHVSIYILVKLEEDEHKHYYFSSNLDCQSHVLLCRIYTKQFSDIYFMPLLF